MLSLITILATASVASAHFCVRYNTFDCSDYDLKSYPTDGIEAGMIIGTKENVPDALSDFTGLWYFQGNPLSDEVVSFAGTTLDAASGSFARKVYDAGIWSWDDDFNGHALWQAARLTELVYLISVTNSTTYHVTPTVHLPPALLDLNFAVGPQFAEFDIVRTDDPNVWLRPSSFFGKAVASYTWFRIVNEDGSRTDYYNSVYLANIGNARNISSVHLGTSQIVPQYKGQLSF